MELLIVTGMSGAGKSQAVDVLEDIGYYCVDNVPPSLIINFTRLPGDASRRIDRIALVVDVRSREMFDDLQLCLDELKSVNICYKILFLDCGDDVLATRYKETRRRHPLLDDLSASILSAIGEERRILSGIHEKADYIIDTTMLSASQLRSRIREIFIRGTSRMVINCMSFGFKFGLPKDSDLVFDLRCLPNPFYIKELRSLTGLDMPIQSFLLEHNSVVEFQKKLYDMIDFLLPLYIEEGKSQLVISIGCTGGKHRSVAFANWLSEHLLALGYEVNGIHRDVDRH